MIVEKINNLIERCKDDSDEMSIIYDMTESCRRYIDALMAQSQALQIQKFRLDHEAYIQLLRDAQERRSLLHNAMCMLIRATDRLCKSKNIDIIYGGENHRLDYAIFAKKLCVEYYDMRIKDIDIDGEG